MNETKTLTSSDLEVTKNLEEDTMSLVSSLRDSLSSEEEREKCDEIESMIDGFEQYKENSVYHRKLLLEDLNKLIPEYERSEKELLKVSRKLARQEMLKNLRMSPEETMLNESIRSKYLEYVRRLE